MRLALAPMAVLALALSGCPQPPPAPTNTTLPRAFAKVSTRLETGITYREYPELIAEPRLELKLYADSAEGKAHPGAVTEYGRALDVYMDAGRLWQLKFDKYSYDPLYGMPYGSESAREWELKYPALTQEAKMVIGNGFSADRMLPIMWREAGKMADAAAVKMKP